MKLSDSSTEWVPAKSYFFVIEYVYTYTFIYTFICIDIIYIYIYIYVCIYIYMCLQEIYHNDIRE
jgi:hypothetical protein